MPTVTKQTNRVIQKPVPTQTSRSVDPWGAVNSLRILVYGTSGSGKTTFAGTFPGPILWLICSGGSQPGELRSIDTPEHRAKIKPVVIESTDRFRSEVEGAAGNETVVLDHASGFADLIIKELLGLKEVPVGKSRVAGKGESWSLVSQQQYGQLAIIAKEAFRDLLNTSGNVVFLAQERTFGGEEAQASDVIRPTVSAAMTPSLAGWLAPACDFVVQTFKRPRMEETKNVVGGKTITTMRRGRGAEYCLRTGPHDVYQTKFRIPAGRPLPECIVLGDSVTGLADGSGYEQMLALIRGEGTP